MPSLEPFGKREGIKHIVLQRTVFPGAIAAYGMDVIMLQQRHLFHLVLFRMAGDVDIGGIHQNMMLGDQTLACDYSGIMQVVKRALQKTANLPYRLLLPKAYLDIKRHALLSDYIVIETDTIEQIPVFRNIHPTIGALGTLCVKAEIKDQNLVPGINSAIIRHGADVKQPWKRHR